MNKVVLVGRLTRDPEVRYSQGDSATAVARYTLAVDRRFKRDNEPTADFIPCVVFGRSGEFAAVSYTHLPPEYNKSVREFDVVTLDRIKKIDVEENFDVWKEYAYRQGIHPAVISYLELRKENFYRIETTVDGRYFATARGWEDLSQLIQVYESLHKTVDRDVVYQYIQHRTISKDFANYLELYYKYKQDYGCLLYTSILAADPLWGELRF